MAVQGFGAVGKHVSRFLSWKGAIPWPWPTPTGAIHNPDGLDVEKLIAKSEGQSVTEYRDGEKLGREDIIDVECDIWIPAARPDVIHADNVNRLNTRLVVEGANIPITHGAEKILHDKGCSVYRILSPMPVALSVPRWNTRVPARLLQWRLSKKNCGAIPLKCCRLQKTNRCCHGKQRWRWHVNVSTGR